MYLWYDKVSSPIGTIVLAGRNGRLYALDFDDCRARMHALLQRRFRSVQLERFYNFDGQPEKICAYFKGDLIALEDIEVETRGTSFQRRVWLALRQIRCGMTISYGVLACSLGFPSAARAVGLANSLNPIALVIPCHRVIGVQGSLTGYAGGLHRKRWLLTHEGIELRLDAKGSHSAGSPSSSEFSSLGSWRTDVPANQSDRRTPRED